MRKLYFTNTSFLFAIDNSAIRDNFAKIAENIVLQATNAEYYFRDGKEEVDFLLRDGSQIVPVEVKYGSYDLKKFFSVLKKLECNYGIIISENDFGAHRHDGVYVTVVPLWLFVLFPDKFVHREIKP